MVIRRWDLCLKSHAKDWRNPKSNPGPPVNKMSSFTNTPQRLLDRNVSSVDPDQTTLGTGAV